MRSQAPQHDLESHHYYRHRTMTTAPTSLWALTEEARRLAAEIEELARGLYGDDAEEAALAVVGLEDACCGKRRTAMPSGRRPMATAT
jgi:hypothetical protein